MLSAIKNEDLQILMEKAHPAAKAGVAASYIPALQQMDPALFGCAVYRNRTFVEAGHTQKNFTLQSVSKIVSLALALMEHGEEYVFERVGMEPTGNPFHTVQALEREKPSRPLNPMINAGALVVTSMLIGNNERESIDRFLFLLNKLTGNPAVKICEETAASERSHSDLNRSLCYFLKGHKVLEGDVETVLKTYINQCSALVTCRQLAKMGSVIGNNGRDPETNEEIIPPRAAKIVTTFMVTCGMYNASGSFAIKAGIPAKSGVSGALLASLPNGMGIGVYSPPLDKKGNSAAGVRLLESMSKKYRLSIFSGSL